MKIDLQVMFLARADRENSKSICRGHGGRGLNGLAIGACIHIRRTSLQSQPFHSRNNEYLSLASTPARVKEDGNSVT